MIYYKIDVLDELKAKGWTPSKIRELKLISEQTLQNLRNNKPVTFQTLNVLCDLLKKQPGQIIGFKPENQEQTKE